jgi:nucleotide-binding universal stress UspA family protein/nitrite reductase/ring-hydroxylating ferredoxin subunit
MFHTILVGTDGSATARTAEDVATELARAVGGWLLVVSAYHEGTEARAAAEEMVQEAARRAGEEGVTVRTEVAEGEPADVVVDAADRADADLVVVGDIGMGQERRLRLGGVPDRISHAAPCSVLVVRTSKLGDGPAAPEPGASYRKLLVATDGSPTAAHAASLGAGLATTLGATITLVYAGDELMGRIILKDAAERLGDPDLPQRVVSGAPGEAIARLAQLEGHDLIVVGNRGMAGAARMLGSVPNTVSHAAGCDVLIVNTVGRSLADLQPGEGAIVDQGGRKVAGYRDESGRLLALSRKCTHLGCSVEWNSSLKTWDCPCHGSRYDQRGKVIQGPAQRDLDEIAI